MATSTDEFHDELVALEPRLGNLLAEARAVKDTGEGEYFCCNAVFFGYEGHPGFKPRIRLLVGWDRLLGRDFGKDAILGTTQAYETAYDTIYEALPPCRGPCACLWAGSYHRSAG
jgi:hypothetical protein